MAPYLAHMDVNTLPYRLALGTWIRTAYPFKVHECLASAKPVVAAAVVELGRHRDVMALCDTPDQRVDCLEQWLREALFAGSG